MVKSALCLSGLVGGAKGKDGKGPQLDVDVPFKHYQQHILKKNNVDVFIHSWSLGCATGLRELYKPSASIFEKQIHFSDNFRKHVIHSRWYSQKQVLQLKRRYEKKNGFRYDMVMVSRLDLLWFTDVVFKDYSPKNFYASYWNHCGPMGGKGVGPYDRCNLKDGKAFLDFWFFSGSANIDKFGRLYDNLRGSLSKVKLSSHYLARAWVNRLKLPVKYVFWRGFDHELYRRWRQPGWHVGV